MFKKTCLTLAVLALGGCRIVSQQELADLKSPPNPHMANMDKTWQQSIVPQVVTKARPAAELMSALKAAKDIDSACKTSATVRRMKTPASSTSRFQVPSANSIPPRAAAK